MDKSEKKAMERSTSMKIVFSLIIDLLSFTLILPLFPSIINHYESNDQSGSYKYFESWMESLRVTLNTPKEYNKVLFSGIIGSWFSFLQFISSPLIGSLSDVYGRRPLLLFTLTGGLISYLIWAFSGLSFTLFLISRTIGGLCKGNISLSTAIFTDVSPPEKRSSAMAMIGISFSVGFVVGPMLGAYLSILNRNHFNNNAFALPALFAVILAIINLIFVYMHFEETLEKNKRSESIGKGLSQAPNFINPISLFSFSPVQNIKRKDLHILREAGWINFLYLFLYSGLEYTLTFLTHLRFNYTSMQQGKLYLFAGVLMILIQGTIVRKFKFGKELVMTAIGLSLIIPGFMIIAFATNILNLYIGLSLYSVASAIVVPCLTAIASNQGSDYQKGTVLGIFRSIGALARALGPIVSSVLFWTLGSTWCYFIGASALFIPLLYLFKLNALMKKK